MTRTPADARTPRGAAWTALAVLLGAASVMAWWLPANALDWQPELALVEPWRAWTAAFVHWSARHLLANLVATAVVAALGRVGGGLPLSAALAWFAAWPLTQLGLLLQPALAHYGGLSGVLHAGVAVGTLWLLVQPQELARAQRAARDRVRGLSAALLAGLLLKVLLEQPWGAPLRQADGWDIAIAPVAHATGTAAGLLCAALALLMVRRRGHRQSAA